jgi:hypothetical protein
MTLFRHFVENCLNRMSIKPLSAVTHEDKDVTVQVQVNRKWEFRGAKDDGPVLHVDMVLTDAMVIIIYLCLYCLPVLSNT